MKRILSIIMMLFFLIPGANAEPDHALEICIMKYNSVAETIGAKSIDLSTETESEGLKVYYAGTCLIVFRLDDNGTPTNAGVYKTLTAKPEDFLLDCMAVITFMGNMDYEAYGHMLSQYAEIMKGSDESLPYYMGFDLFKMEKRNMKEILFTYYNYNLDTWI